MKNYLRDLRFWFFALGATLAVAISAPNTYQIAAPLHGGGDGWYGIVLTVALVALLEAGAVGAEIAGVQWLCWSLLGLTFVANVTIGSAAFDMTDLAAKPSLAAWRASGYGWLLVLFYSASVPVLLYTFLHYALARVRELSAPGAQEVRTPAQDMAEALRTLLSELRTPAQLPDQVVYPRPEEVRTQPVTAPDFTCDGCGAEATAHQRRSYAQHRAWVCKGCGKRHAGR
jgi:hypothetical protein